MKKTIRLTENELKQLVKRSINEITKGELENNQGNYQEVLPLLRQAEELVRKAVSQLDGERSIRIELSKGYQTYMHSPGNFEWSGGIWIDDELVG